MIGRSSPLRGLGLPWEYRCPNHPSVGLILMCAICRRRLEDHAERIAALGPVRRER